MPKPKLNRIVYHATMPPEILQRIDDYAGSKGKTRSAVLEAAAESYLDRHEEKPKVKVGPRKR
jgi:metal-responsive CopG/Arc/MetJ family transcriptional regulator